MKNISITLVFLLFCLSAIAQDCTLNEEAKSHMLKAEEMSERKVNPDYMQLVADEYEKAAQAAPYCAGIYYNLGFCYNKLLGKTHPELCDKAIVNYRKYLQLNPYAENKNEVEELIYKIEGKKFLYQKQYVGTWYEFTPDGNWGLSYTYCQLYGFEIFISQGNLVAKVIYRYDAVENTPGERYSTIQPIFTYQTVPVTFKGQNISFSYSWTYNGFRNNFDTKIKSKGYTNGYSLDYDEDSKKLVGKWIGNEVNKIGNVIYLFVNENDTNREHSIFFKFEKQ